MTNRKRSRADLNNVLQNIHAVGQGVWDVHIYAAEAFVEALLNPGAITDDMFHDCSVVERALQQIERHVDTLCLLCDTTFSAAKLPRRFVILRPSLDAIRATPDGGVHVIANGICWDCDAKPDLPARVIDFYRRNIISDLREIQLAAAGAA